MIKLFTMAAMMLLTVRPNIVSDVTRLLPDGD